MSQVRERDLHPDHQHAPVAFYSNPEPQLRERILEENLMMLESLGILFKNDPTFEYIFRELPRGMFMKIYEIRRKRVETEPQIPGLT